MAIEQVDIFDADFKLLPPFRASMDEAHRKGLWHQTFAAWIVTPRRSVILQLRGPKNRVGAGKLDASAGGHLSSGEHKEDGFREMAEELGVLPDTESRSYLGFFRNTADIGPYINREFCHVFLVRSSLSLRDFVLQAGEVAGAFEMGIADGIRLFSSENEEIRVSGVVGGIEESRLARPSDFCNHPERGGKEGYYAKVLRAAAEYGAGNPSSPPVFEG